MSADEPALLQRLRHRGLRIPQADIEVRPMLVDGNGLISILDHAAQRGVVEFIEFHVGVLENTDGNAESAHGVPHAEEFDLDLFAEGRSKNFRGERIHAIAAGAVNAVRHRDAESEVLRQNQTAVADHADQAAGRVGAATEAKNVDLVAILILFGEKFVALNDIELQTCADGAADEAVVPFGADAFVVPFDLLATVRAFVFDRFVEAAYIGFHALRGGQRFVRRFIPGSVETDHYTCHRTSYSDWSNGVMELWSNEVPDPALHHSNTPVRQFLPT